MGGSIHDAVLRGVVLRKIFALSGGVKSELKHLHSGIGRLLQQLPYRRGDYSQILRNDTILSGFPLYDLEKVVFRTLVPFAAVRGLVSERNSVVAVEADEVVYTDDIIQLLCKTHSADPPAVVFLLHSVPVVDGISPQLPVRRESVRRETGNNGGNSVLVQLEQLRLAPDVGAVQRAVNRDITDDLYSIAVRVFLQPEPLLKELELKERIELHVLCVLLLRRIHRILVAQAQWLFPLAPAFSAVSVLERHEQRIILQPGIFLYELRVFSGNVTIHVL